jgi:hypothetical protein
MSRMSALLKIFTFIKLVGWIGRRSAILPGGGKAAHLFLVPENDDARVNSLRAMQLSLKALCLPEGEMLGIPWITMDSTLVILANF